MATYQRRVQVLFEPEQYSRLEREAERERTSVGAYIRECVDERLRSTKAERAAAWARLEAWSALGVGKEPDDPRELVAELDREFDEYLDKKMGNI